VRLFLILLTLVLSRVTQAQVKMLTRADTVGGAGIVKLVTLTYFNAHISGVGVYEPVLGNPGTTGYVLSSTTAGVRSWVAQSGGSFDTTNVITKFKLANGDVIQDVNLYSPNSLSSIGLSNTGFATSGVNASVASQVSANDEGVATLSASSLITSRSSKIDFDTLGAHITFINNINGALTINGDTVLTASQITNRSSASSYVANLYLSADNAPESPYKFLDYEPDASETTTTIVANAGTTQGYKYLYSNNVGATTIPGGQWGFSIYGNVSNSALVSTINVRVFKKNTSETTLFTATSEEINNTADARIVFNTIQPGFTVLTTDTIGLQVSFTTTRTSNTTLTYTIGDGNASYVTSPLPIRHNLLRALGWTDSGHTGTASTVAGFNSSGQVVCLPITSLIPEDTLYISSANILSGINDTLVHTNSGTTQTIYTTCLINYRHVSTAYTGGTADTIAVFGKYKGVKKKLLYISSSYITEAYSGRGQFPIAWDKLDPGSPIWVHIPSFSAGDGILRMRFKKLTETW
jgi:hypothetical protein